MDDRNFKRSYANRFSVFLLLMPLLMVAACTATGTGTGKGKVTSRSSARIDVQRDVGFTITEKAHISGNVRADYEAALMLLEQEQYEQGLDLLEAVVEEAPDLTAPRIDLGIAYHRMGNLDAARDNLMQAIELNPDHPVALTELGIVFRKTGRFAEARKSYEAALAVYPGYHYARRNLAILCDLYLGDLDCALQNYEAYMTTVAEDAQAEIWIADIRQRLGQ